MKILRPALALAFFTLTLPAQMPLLINHQGRVAVGGVNLDGTGSFKFALMNGTGTTTFWSNDGTSTAGSQPTNAVQLTVTRGLYSVLLGDTTLANMTGVPTFVFNNADVRLRVWFNDGTHGSQLLTPDQRFGAAGLAMVAITVPDNSITSAKISTGVDGEGVFHGHVAGETVSWPPRQPVHHLHSRAERDSLCSVQPAGRRGSVGNAGGVPFGNRGRFPTFLSSTGSLGVAGCGRHF